MPVLDEKGRMLLIGIVAGTAGAVFGRDLFAPVRRLGRPLAKTALMSGLIAVERGREGFALMTEHVGDLMAEVAAEREAALRHAK